MGEDHSSTAVKGRGVRVVFSKHNCPKRRRNVRRRFAALFVFAAVFVSMNGLIACGETAKEDPAEEERQELQPQVQQPELTEPTAGEQTDRTIGENIQG